jgi:DnaJ-class molecular chaperone
MERPLYKCALCNGSGTGAKLCHPDAPCPACKGDGEFHMRGTAIRCKRCSGTGVEPRFGICNTCNGKGWISASYAEY